MQRRRHRVAGLVVVGLTFVGAAAVARAGEGPGEGARASGGELVEADAAALVAAMSRALRTLNYEGTFVHVQGTTVSSMRIVHAYDGRGELERMSALDGEAREVIRDHSLVTCIWPGSDSVVVSKAKPRKLLPNVDAALFDGGRYVIERAGRDRVAGVETDIVAIRSRDAYRYGYRFWIDRETRMLLRSMLLDGERPVEQLMFTDIRYPERIPRERFEVALDTERLSWIEPPAADASGTAASELERLLGGDASGVAEREIVDAADAPDRVDFAALPAGYAELSETDLAMEEGSPPLSHVMVSDGMASVSVYVEHAASGAQDRSAEGLSSMGAMNAYGLSLEAGFVTVVGEVPAATVRAIAEAVRIVE